MIVAAALCPAPPLLAPELTGRDAELPELRELREACAEATRRLLRAGPETVTVVGAAPETALWDPVSRADLRAFAPAAPVPAGTPGLPSSLGLGAMLLDQAGYGGRRILQAVGQDEPAAACVGLGERLARPAEPTALLVMADGSARRGRRAPGHYDERSAGFDAAVERGIRDGDLEALTAVDPGLADELMATGRPAWQVLAGAMRALRPSSDVLYAGDPFGVAYLVASLTVASPGRAGTGR